MGGGPGHFGQSYTKYYPASAMTSSGISRDITQIDWEPHLWFRCFGGPENSVFERLRIDLFTLDDVVNQRLKFGSAFLSSSWESKIALFF